MRIGNTSRLASVIVAGAFAAACGSSPVSPSTSAAPLASLSRGESQTESGSGNTGASCTFINDFKVTSGYTPSSNSSLGAVWVQWKLNPCSSPSGQGIQILVKLTESATGTVLYSVPGMFAQQTIDFDNMKTGTAYHVDFSISDNGTGALLVSRSADVTTPSHNNAGI